LVYRNVITSTPTLALVAASNSGFKTDNVTSVRRPFFTGTTDPGAFVDLVNSANNQVLGTAAADATGKFTGQLSPGSDLKNGTYSIIARAHGPVGSTGPVSAPVTVKLVTVDGDYFGTGATQQAVFQRTGPFLATWFINGPTTQLIRTFGAGSMDVPLTGDFFGSGKTDLALFRPSTGQWFVQSSTTGYTGQLLATFGNQNFIPVPADYNGDGKTDVALFLPATGAWFVTGQSTTFNFGSVRTGEIPVPGDYDNTGAAEFALYRPNTGTWLINSPNGTRSVSFGGPSDVPVPGAYDATAANRSIEPGVFRPSTGQYFIHGPGGNRVIQFNVGDIPAPGDYYGTGVTQAAVFRPSTGRWYTAGPTDTVPKLLPAAYGSPADIPTLSPYRYRALRGGSGGISASGVPSTGSSGVVMNFGSTAHNLSSGSVAGNVSSSLTPAAAAAPVNLKQQFQSARHRPAQTAAQVALAHRLANHLAAIKKAKGHHA